MAQAVDDFRSLVFGGLRDYLDLKAYEEISDIERKPLNAENPIFIKQESALPQRVGESTALLPTGASGLIWIGGGLLALVLVIALLRRG